VKVTGPEAVTCSFAHRGRHFNCENSKMQPSDVWMIKRTIHGLSIKDRIASVLLQGRVQTKSTRRGTPWRPAAQPGIGLHAAWQAGVLNISLGYGLAVDLAGCRARLTPAVGACASRSRPATVS
jgi:hypothetical protein